MPSIIDKIRSTIQGNLETSLKQPRRDIPEDNLEQSNVQIPAKPIQAHKASKDSNKRLTDLRSTKLLSSTGF